MRESCDLCGGLCGDSDLEPLLQPRLIWLWQQVAAAADRRGDAELRDGFLDIQAPASAEERSAAGALVGERLLKAGQSRRVDLARLTTKLSVRGSNLSPGAVAAHAVGRPLAVRTKAEAEREQVETRLRDLFDDLVLRLAATATVPKAEAVWPLLRRSGWIKRIVIAPDPRQLITQAVSVLAALPGEGARLDRRRLASDTTGDPHALDDGGNLSGLVLALLVALGRVRGRQRPRDAWAEVAVDADDVTGGLLTLGVVPTGWVLPAGAVVTLPPRILGTCAWPAPDAGSPWVFVTENPSVVSAAADLMAAGNPIRLLCTSGTPSSREIAAIARLASVGWQVAVRADFDVAGLNHVAALLRGVPGAVPWRMDAENYEASILPDRESVERLSVERVPETPWAPSLSTTMKKRAVPGFEEALMSALLRDLTVAGIPAS